MADPVTPHTDARLRADALRILQAGVAAADPGEAVRRTLRLGDGMLIAGGSPPVPIGSGSRVLLLAAGKAAAQMTAAAVEVLGDALAGGAVTLPAGGAAEAACLPAGISVWEGGHPVPAIGGLAGAAEALALAASAEEGDVVLCLLSGGASALWSAPAPDLTLDHLRQTTTELLRSGAPIGEVNTVRKHLSAIAGGRLARAAAPARVLTLAIQDVVATGVDAIGSGPTLPDPTTYADALAVVDRHGVVLPTAALQHLRSGASGVHAETLKPGELPDEAGFEVVLSVVDALAAAAEEARALGYEVRVESAEVEGEAREVGSRVAAEVSAVRAAAAGRMALLWGGETTVSVRGAGAGGRNQEVALAAAIALEGAEGVVIASMGTDGRDGPTDAAGGIVDGGTIARGIAAGLDAGAHLLANDSYPYLLATGDLIATGPTGTNVNDLLIALVSGGSGGATG